ncbi:MAG TPA: hypothetical protein PKZ53_25225, partial [Acidobacteriota bacterium]|nr:hypothetical protein [Acidobacteriota bacterium]
MPLSVQTGVCFKNDEEYPIRFLLVTPFLHLGEQDQSVGGAVLQKGQKGLKGLKVKKKQVCQMGRISSFFILNSSFFILNSSF